MAWGTDWKSGTGLQALAIGKHLMPDTGRLFQIPDMMDAENGHNKER